MMGTKRNHPAGNFSWFELGTNDQDAAKAFYSSLFGWGYNDSPMGEGMGVYTMFHLGGEDVGGAYTLNPQHHAGVPPHWMPYVAVESADASMAKAAELGGDIVAPAFDVFDFGRMAVLKDPTGAIISLWQPRAHKGADLVMAPNSVGWTELATRDAANAKSFYAGLFGWILHAGSAGGMEYTEIENAGQRIGGIMAMEGPQWEGIPPHWMIYFVVTDCEATAAKAAELGGRLNVPPMDIPNVGKFSVIADPQGAVFSIIQLMPHS